MAPVGRPENVLKRSEELIAVDQSSAALQLLYETISSKRMRSVNQSYIEPLILKFIDLCVELRKGKVVKDGLHQYKKLIQATEAGNMGPVVERFLQLSEEKVTSAQAQADKLTLDVEDLEASDSPEDILLATVSSEQTKDRTDRELVTPWLKFLWEAYRCVLDVLRNNSKLEVEYQQVVKRAFEFCIKYSRKTEFRRLCELLRGHLQSASGQARNSNAPNPIDLSDADTVQRYLDTRFDQLNSAVRLELWQEAFRSVEDVHTLLTVSKRPAKVNTMANYYEKLAKIFLVGGNHLYHAAAWSRFYALVLQTRSVPESEMTRIASLLLLSVLSIPPVSGSSIGHSAFGGGASFEDDQKHRNQRLAGLLNLPKPPTREGLLQSALAKNVLAHVRPEIRDLYETLEVDFHPLSLKKRLAPSIDRIGADAAYQPYIRPLNHVVLTRLLQQLSQVYETVRLDFVVGLATLPAPFNLTPVEIENSIVMGCFRGEFSVRIDHSSKSLFFETTAPIAGLSGDQSNQQGAAATLQKTPAEILHTQLSSLAKVLSSAVADVDPLYWQNFRQSLAESQERAAIGLDAENAAIWDRRERIEARRKEAEAAALKREEEETKRRLAKIQAEQQAEQERLAEEERKREHDRIRREQDAIREEEKRKLAEEINAKGILKIDVNNMEDLDTNKLRVMQIQQLEKEKNDLNERVRIIGRRMDHVERAFRLEEAPLWEQQAETQVAVDRKAYEAKKKALLATSKAQFDEAQELKARLERIVPEYQKFRAAIEERRREMFEAKRKENERLFEQAKAERIAQVKADRARRAKEEQERQEREAREEEERLKREAEEAAKPKRYVPGALRGSAGAPAPRAPPSYAGAAAAAPVSPAAPRSSPFGGANPVETRVPTATRASSSPFGTARPVATKEPVAAAEAEQPKPNVYRPGALRSSPAPVPMRSSPSPAARGDSPSQGSPSPQPKPANPNRYVPPSRR